MSRRAPVGDLSTFSLRPLSFLSGTHRGHFRDTSETPRIHVLSYSCTAGVILVVFMRVDREKHAESPRTRALCAALGSLVTPVHASRRAQRRGTPYCILQPYIARASRTRGPSDVAFEEEHRTRPSWGMNPQASIGCPDCLAVGSRLSDRGGAGGRRGAKRCRVSGAQLPCDGGPCVD